tara:strand:- start:35 stop:892 length:858 start_codon:yes stop_codon:yes gene_type:complete
MAITDINPNNFNETFEKYYNSLPTENIPGMTEPAINYIDSPVGFMMRQNNPTKGFLDQQINYRALNQGTPEATAKFLTRNNFPIPQNLQGIDTRSFLDKTKDTFGKGLDIGKKGLNMGKQGLLAALGLATNLPLGILGMLPERDPRQNALDDFYGNQYGLTSSGSVASGIMKGYNPVSGGLFGTDTNYGLGGAIDKRIARIQKTLDKQRKDKNRKESVALQQRIKDLEKLQAREAAVLNKAGQIAAQKGADEGVSGGGRGSRRGDADISNSARGGFATDDTAGFF